MHIVSMILNNSQNTFNAFFQLNLFSFRWHVLFFSTFWCFRFARTTVKIAVNSFYFYFLLLSEERAWCLARSPPSVQFENCPLEINVHFENRFYGQTNTVYPFEMHTMHNKDLQCHYMCSTRRYSFVQVMPHKLCTLNLFVVHSEFFVVDLTIRFSSLICFKSLHQTDSKEEKNPTFIGKHTKNFCFISFQKIFLPLNSSMQYELSLSNEQKNNQHECLSFSHVHVTMSC